MGDFYVTMLHLKFLHLQEFYSLMKVFAYEVTHICSVFSVLTQGTIFSCITAQTVACLYS